MLWADELLFLFTRKLFIFLGDKHSVVISIKMKKRCCKKENLIRKEKKNKFGRVGWISQESVKPTQVFGHHSDSHQLKENVQLNMSLVGEETTENYGPTFFLAKLHTDLILILVTFD